MMSLNHIEENIDKLRASLKFYGELLDTKKASPVQIQGIRLKQEVVKKEILKLTLKNKKLLAGLEEMYRPGGRHG